MTKIKFFITLFALIALSFGVLEIKSFLNQNFIEHETPVKKALNNFLNGK